MSSNIISPNYDKQQYYFILPNSANHQYYFTLPNYANHSRFEWVNLFSGDLWWGCIYPVILKTVTTPAPPLIQVTPAPAAAAASDSASFALLQTFIINKTRG